MNWKNLDLNTIQEEKKNLRQDLSPVTPNLREAGRVAQQLRSVPFYHRAERIFVSPAKELSQIRINCLVDGKELIMPGPALKDGFYVLQPYTINFIDLEYAVSPKGLKRYGKLLDLSREFPVDLFLTDGLALNLNGSRLGDGNGFFDLAFAVLSWSCSDNSNHIVGMVCNEEQIISRQIPRAPWDVDVNFYISSRTWNEIFSENRQSRYMKEEGPIFWKQLNEKRIRKVSPLWKIWKNRS